MKRALLGIGLAAAFLPGPLAAGGPQVGGPAPRIQISEWLSGEIRGDGPLAGKVVVLEFFATWCRPCWAAVPHMNELVARFAGDRVIFISMSDENRDKVAGYIDQMGIKARVVLDRNMETARDYDVETIPYMYLIDSHGVVRWRGHPMAFSEQMMSDFLKTEAAGSSGSATR